MKNPLLRNELIPGPLPGLPWKGICLRVGMVSISCLVWDISIWKNVFSHELANKMNLGISQGPSSLCWFQWWMQIVKHYGVFASWWGLCKVLRGSWAEPDSSCSCEEALWCPLLRQCHSTGRKFLATTSRLETLEAQDSNWDRRKPVFNSQAVAPNCSWTVWLDGWGKAS